MTNTVHTQEVLTELPHLLIMIEHLTSERDALRADSERLEFALPFLFGNDRDITDFRAAANEKTLAGCATTRSVIDAIRKDLLDTAARKEKP